MDSDGFMLLIDKNSAKFEEWKKRSPEMSLEELLRTYFEWKDQISESFEKYWFKSGDDATKDIPAFTATIMHFMYLIAFAWNVLESYTAKLQSEYALLKKSKPAKRAKKRGKKL